MSSCDTDCSGEMVHCLFNFSVLVLVRLLVFWEQGLVQ